MTASPTLPTIHLNGTSAESLRDEYYAVRMAIKGAMNALENATLNARDFYPQDHENWVRAQKERADVFRLLRQVSDFAEAWEEVAQDYIDLKNIHF